MNPDEILEKVIASAFVDFEISPAERDDFRETVAGMFDDQAYHYPIDTNERFMEVLAAYSDASRGQKCYRNVEIVDAACYATEMCLAVQYAESNPELKKAIGIVLGGQ